MNRLELLYFALSFFLALVAMREWQRRRTLAQARLKRGLNSYVSTDTAVTCPTRDSAAVQSCKAELSIAG